MEGSGRPAIAERVAAGRACGIRTRRVALHSGWWNCINRLHPDDAPFAKRRHSGKCAPPGKVLPSTVKRRTGKRQRGVLGAARDIAMSGEERSQIARDQPSKSLSRRRHRNLWHPRYQVASSGGESSQVLPDSLAMALPIKAVSSECSSSERAHPVSSETPSFPPIGATN